MVFHGWQKLALVLAVSSGTGCGATGTSGVAGIAAVAELEPGSSALGSTTPLTTEKAVAADSVVDSIGVNSHFDYTGTPYYDEYPTVSALLLASGIRHIRDGEPNEPDWYYERLKTLGAEGIRSSVGFSATASDSTVESIAASVPYIEAVEGPNEADSSGDPNWVNSVRSFQQRLYSDVKATPSLAGVPVWGPSLASFGNAAALGNLSPFLDAGNVHDYACNYYPGNPGTGPTLFGNYGSIVTGVQAERVIAGSKPLVTTETGYSDTPTRSCMTPDVVIAKYDPRLVLERWLDGFSRTYLYQLSDMPSDPIFGYLGLIDSSQRPKPQYTSLKSMIHLLADPGPAFQPSSLAFSLQGGDAGIHHLLLQKRNGMYLLLIWHEVSSYNLSTSTAIDVAPVSVTLTLGLASPSAVQYNYLSDGLLATETLPISSTGSTTMKIGDSVSFIEIR